MTDQKKAKVGANITDALNTTGNVPRTMDNVKWNVVFKVVDYFEEPTARKSETLQQFYVVMYVQWICPITKNTVSSDRMVSAMNWTSCGSHHRSALAAANANKNRTTYARGGRCYKI